MSNGHRWSKFWWQDWSGDIALRMCGLAARGLWIELLCLAHNAEPYGHVLLNGKPPTMRQIAAIVGASSEREVKRLLDELENAGAFSRTADGVIYCRRMVRDARMSQSGAEEVRKKWGTGEASGKSRSERMSVARSKGTHSPDEWMAMLHVCGDRCLRCDSPSDNNGSGLVKDHIKPIYQGGSDGIENIQPMCRRCNAAKGPDTTDYRPPDWQKRLGQCLGQRLGECLGVDQIMPRSTPTLEADSEAEAEDRKEKKVLNLSSQGEFVSPREAKSAPILPDLVEPVVINVEAAEAAAAVIAALGKTMRRTAFAPCPHPQRHSILKPDELAAVLAPRRPKPAYLTAEQLRATRKAAGMPLA